MTPSTEQQTQSNQQSAVADGEEEIYEYRDSHIRERHGRVPLWLWLVTAGLVIWSVYYLDVYWYAPHPTIF
jgi:hypothetical protein